MFEEIMKKSFDKVDQDRHRMNKKTKKWEREEEKII